MYLVRCKGLKRKADLAVGHARLGSPSREVGLSSLASTAKPTLKISLDSLIKIVKCSDGRSAYLSIKKRL